MEWWLCFDCGIVLSKASERSGIDCGILLELVRAVNSRDAG